MRFSMSPYQSSRQSLFHHRLFLYEFERMKSFDSGVVDGWRKEHPNERTYTHTNSNQGKSRVDRIYIREDWERRAKNWEIWDSFQGLDHRRVEFQLTLPELVVRGPERTRQTLSKPQLRRLFLDLPTPLFTPTAILPGVIHADLVDLGRLGRQQLIEMHCLCTSEEDRHTELHVCMHYHICREVGKYALLDVTSSEQPLVSLPSSPSFTRVRGRQLLAFSLLPSQA